MTCLRATGAYALSSRGLPLPLLLPCHGGACHFALPCPALRARVEPSSSSRQVVLTTCQPF